MAELHFAVSSRCRQGRTPQRPPVLAAECRASVAGPYHHSRHLNGSVMHPLSLYLLGPPRLERDGEPIHIGRTKAMALLAYLAVEGGRHRRESLVTLLSPEFDASRARAELRRTLSILNGILGQGWLAVDHETVGLDLPRERRGRQAQPDSLLQARNDPELWLDVDQFRRHLHVRREHGHPPTGVCPECARLLAQAAELYRGDFMAGFTLPDSLEFEEWQFFQAQSLRDQLTRLLQYLIEWHREQAELDDALDYAQRWWAMDPTHEPAHRQLMLLYAEAGQKAAALRQYNLCEQTLAAELGLPPSTETTALYERIRAGVDIGREREPEFVVPHNLPPQSTPFIGRETELAELKELIASSETRLVTILGPGGIGKTRLALEVAKRFLDAGPEDKADATFPDGVFFVPLARLSAADQIVPSLAEALAFGMGGGERESRTPRQQVLDYLRAKRILLIFDNFEHLLEGVDLVTDILRTAPEVQLLVTSRERLNLHQEHACAIQGLEYPEDALATDWEEYAAVELFRNTARRIQTRFEPSSKDTASLTRICQLLEGMPLAIELAAGWVDVLSLANIAAEIERGLDFLEAEWHDVPARHRSMRAVFDTSWRYLSHAERDIFAQLCVFRGGFTRRAAREVAGADLRMLARLVDKSVLRFNGTLQRYEIHELLRQYGCERLAADSEQERAIRDRHSAYYCDALGRWGDAWNRGKRLDPEFDLEWDWGNLRAAWEWAAGQMDACRLDLALDGMVRLFSVRLLLNRDSERLLQLVVDRLSEKPEPRNADDKRVLVKALLSRCDFNLFAGQVDLARSGILQSKALLADAALAACDTRAERAHMHVVLAQQSDPDWDEMRRHFQSALVLQCELGFEGKVAYRHLNIAWTFLGSGEFDKAKQSCERCLALFRAFGNHHGVNRSLVFLGRLARCTVDHREAQRRYEEALELARARGSQGDMANALCEMGYLAGFLGDFRAEAGYLRESAVLLRRIGNREYLSDTLAQLSLAHWFCGEFAQAYALIEESLAIAEEAESPAALLHSTGYCSWLEAAAGNYASARTHVQNALALHQSCRAGELMDLGIPQAALGWVAVAEGDNEGARLALLQSIDTFQQHSRLDECAEFIAWCLAALGRAEHGAGNHARAKEHLLEALRICTDIRAIIPLLHLMPIIPVVLADEAEPHLKERAVELYAMATSHSFVATAQLFEDIAGRHIRASTASLPPDVIAAAQERGRALDWWETAEALLHELGW